MAAADPNQNKFVSGMMTNPVFKQLAGEQAIQRIQQMQLAANKLAQDREYNLSEKSFEDSMDINNQRLKSEKKDSSQAEKLTIAGIAGNTLLGGLELRNKLRQAKNTDALTKKLYGVQS